MAQDLVLRAFISAMWIISFLAIFGLEARQLFVYSETAIFIYILVFAFVAVAVTWNYALIRRLSYPRVIQGGQVKVVALRQARDPVHAMVLDRARQLGIGARIGVFTIPGTSGQINAYVWSWLGHHNLALSDKAAQYGLLRGDRKRKFDLVVDHELGHIRNRDSGIIYRAKAIFWTSVAFIPVKLLAVAILQSGNFLFLERVFPARWRPIGFGGLPRVIEGHALSLVPFPTRWPAYLVVITIILYNIGTLLVLYVLFRAIAQRREFLADNFALQHASDRTLVLEDFRVIAAQESISAGAPAAFSSLYVWHPSPGARLRNLTKPEKTVLLDVLVGVLGMFVLAYARFCFAGDLFTSHVPAFIRSTNIINVRIPPGVTQLIVNVVAVYSAAYILGCVSQLDLTKKDTLISQLIQIIGSMACAGLILAAVVIAIWHFSTVEPYYTYLYTYLSGHQFDYQRALDAWANYDMLWLIGSFPIIAIAFALGGMISSLLLFIPVIRQLLQWLRPLVGVIVSLLIVRGITNAITTTFMYGQLDHFFNVLNVLQRDYSELQNCKEFPRPLLGPPPPQMTCAVEKKYVEGFFWATMNKLKRVTFLPPWSLLSFSDHPYSNQEM